MSRPEGFADCAGRPGGARYCQCRMAVVAPRMTRIGHVPRVSGMSSAHDDVPPSHPGPRRPEVEASLTQLPPVPDVETGIYAASNAYDRRRVLARAAGDDLPAIRASASADAAACMRAGLLWIAAGVPPWIAGVASLFLHGATARAMVLLGLGTLGMARGVGRLARASHDRIFLGELSQLFPGHGEAP